MPEEVNVSFDTEVVLNGDAVGRSRHERFFFVFCNYARENLILRKRSQKKQSTAFEGTFACV